MYFQIFVVTFVVFHNSECKYVEEDYYDEDKNIPNVSWVPIISRRDEKIKEAFDVLAKSEGNENEYIKKLNRIAEMLNVISFKTFHHYQFFNL
uniref:Cystatin domain-containing protein n=1 Tax=Strongyloides papillosus TaxID=174720 RepID=A0A0N5BQN9_STREA